MQIVFEIILEIKSTTAYESKILVTQLFNLHQNSDYLVEIQKQTSALNGVTNEIRVLKVLKDMFCKCSW